MLGRQIKVQNPKQISCQSNLMNKEVQNFSPRSEDIEELQKIDCISRAKNMGSVAPFKDMIPNYASSNNTFT